jgi:glycosyltransferase involved in cell wall biosynthesis
MKVENNIPVVFAPAGEDACAFYRMWLPHLNLPLSDYYFSGWNTDGTPKIMDLQRFMDKRIAIVQRQGSIFNLKAIHAMHQVGVRIIYDLDDNLWSLPHGNPAKKVFMQNQQGFAMCAKECDLLTVSTQGLKAAASVALPHKEIQVIPNAMDFNLFQKKEINRDDGCVVIGWGGSNTHLDDMSQVFNIMPEVLDACPQALMEVVGAPPMIETVQTVVVLDILKREETVNKTALELKADVTEKTKKVMVPYALLIEDVKTKQRDKVPWHEFKKTDTSTYLKGGTNIKVKGKDIVGQTMTRLVLIPSKLTYHPKYRFKGWAPMREYSNRLSSWAWDIGVAALEDVRFNTSKSNIKMLEAAAMQIPCLVSPIQPYVEMCALGGKDLGWLLCHNSQEWKSKLVCLINEPERRQYLGMKLYETAKKYFDIEKIKEHWNYAFTKVLQ